MGLIQGFSLEDKFYDDLHFPRGFGKSGDFSIADADLLTDLGKRLLMLEKAQCEPKNNIEKRFVKVCKLQVEAQSKIELLWLKYKKLTQCKIFHSLHGSL